MNFPLTATKLLLCPKYKLLDDPLIDHGVMLACLDHYTIHVKASFMTKSDCSIHMLIIYL